MSNITKRSLNFSVTQCYKTSFDLIYKCLYYARVFDPGRPRKHLKGRLQLYSQTLDKDGKACQGRTLYLTRNIRKNFITLGPVASTLKVFSS